MAVSVHLMDDESPGTEANFLMHLRANDYDALVAHMRMTEEPSGGAITVDAGLALADDVLLNVTFTVSDAVDLVRTSSNT